MKKNINTRKFIEKNIKIKTKDSKIVPFKFNFQQERLYSVIKQLHKEGKPIRIVVLKSRQMGMSTFTEGIIFKKIVTGFNHKAGIITHNADATNNLYNMFKLMYECLPQELKPEKKNTNAKGIVFDNEAGTGLKSSIRCLTAGTSGVGRSDTFNYLHISEYAFWSGDKVDTLSGLLQAVPNTPDSIVIVESTANGYDEFKKLWDEAVAGENDFYPYFASWKDFSEYQMKYTGFTLTPDEEELMKEYNLNLNQITWRRWCIKNNCENDIDKFHQEYPLTPEEAFISTGKCVFDKDKIIKQINKLEKNKKKYKRKGRFTYDIIYNKYGQLDVDNIKWIDDPKGYIEIYKNPLYQVPYVIGGDTAGEGSDYFAGHVINNVTKEQVAVIHKQYIPEDKFAEQVLCLGYLYNTALVGIETNYSTYPQERMVQLNYPNIFSTTHIAGQDKGIPTKQYGFRTTSTTRPYIIAELIKNFNDNPNMIQDIKTLREMLTFVKNNRGRAEAMQGEHDDLVMSLAITVYLEAYQSCIVEEEKPKKQELPEPLQTPTQKESFW